MPLSESIRGRLLHQHETIGELTSGFTEEQLKLRVIEGKWSPFENIVHLTAYQPTFRSRMELILGGNQPFFERYVAENDPVFYSYTQKSLSELFQILAADRQAINSKLRSLTEEQLRLKALHSKFGALTMLQWSDLFLLHEAHHLWTIVQLVCILRVSVPG
ncbi:MAG TPA: DinB family protein [Phycisphaerae bacterium]|nr:DinB family protein [Phycisphaerae bacterium]